MGIEADEAAAVRLVENAIVVAPIAPRAFDGCDVTVRGDSAAMVTIRLRSSPTAEAKDVQVALWRNLPPSSFASRSTNSAATCSCSVRRAIKLRVQLDRDHLVFGPGESVQLAVKPDLAAELAAGPIDARSSLHPRRRRRRAVAVEHASSTATPSLSRSSSAAPRRRRLPLDARRGATAGIAGKLVPWEQNAPVAARDVEFVVVDPRPGCRD